MTALRTYLKKNQISQDAFAKSLGVSKGLVWQWLNGQTSITPENAKKIEAKTGISRMKLLYPDEARAA